MPQTVSLTTCPQHPDQLVQAIVEYRLPDPYGLGVDHLDREFALACTPQCAADARVGALLAGVHPDHIDTYPATPELVADITGDEEVAA